MLIGSRNLHRYFRPFIGKTIGGLLSQIDLEMAFEDGKGVMHSVERLIKDLYGNLAKDANNRTSRLPSGAFLRMKYAEAMGKHGSDKPDLRIPHLVRLQRRCCYVAND